MEGDINGNGNGNTYPAIERRAVRGTNWERWISFTALLIPALVGLLSLYLTFNNQLIKIDIEFAQLRKDVEELQIWQKSFENKVATQDNTTSILKMSMSRNTSECERNEKIIQNLVNKIENLSGVLSQHNEQFSALKERVKKRGEIE